MTRDSFLARVRQAAHQGRAYRVHTRDIPDRAGYVGASHDLCEAMAREVNAVGGQAEIVTDDDQARQAIGHLLVQYRPKVALCWQHPVLEELRLEELLEQHAVSRDDYDSLAPVEESRQRARMLSADIGITSCDWAIAETGSLLMCARPGQERAASLLPPVHVAVVKERQIVPDLLDAVERLNEREAQSEGNRHRLPSNITLITGPSKTGDIELQLTTGVHGPGNWHVIIIRLPVRPELER